MINTWAAAVQLTNMQIIGRKRIVVTLLVFAIPFIVSLLLNWYGSDSVSERYAQVVGGVLIGLLIPFVSVFWGSALLTDEIEGKTLVFLWTRPCGRARLFLMKFAAIALWLMLLSAVSVAICYSVFFLNRTMEPFFNNIQMIVWDSRALALGGITYAALGFFLATLFKRPLILGLIYAYTWDGIAPFLPGFLKKLSIRHHVLSLSTHHTTEKGGFLQLLTQNTTSEGEALMTLAAAAIVLIAAGLYILRSKDFLGDDPARAQ